MRDQKQNPNHDPATCSSLILEGKRCLLRAALREGESTIAANVAEE